MKYEFAEDIQKEAEEISGVLFPHIKMNFVRCIRTREMPRVRPEEGYDVVRILHAAQKSLEGRREIKL